MINSKTRLFIFFTDNLNKNTKIVQRNQPKAQTHFVVCRFLIFTMCHTLAHAPVIFGSMVTYYCISLEEALRRAKIAGKQPGCYYGGITLCSGKKGFAIYRDGKVIEQYSVMANVVTLDGRGP